MPKDAHKMDETEAIRDFYYYQWIRWEQERQSKWSMLSNQLVNEIDRWKLWKEYKIYEKCNCWYNMVHIQTESRWIS